MIRSHPPGQLLLASPQDTGVPVSARPATLFPTPDLPLPVSLLDPPLALESGLFPLWKHIFPMLANFASPEGFLKASEGGSMSLQSHINHQPSEPPA